MGKTFGNSVFTINIYAAGGREEFKSDGRQIQLGELGCLDHLRLNKTPRAVTFFIINKGNDKTII